MVVETVRADGTRESPYGSYWEWLADFEARKNAECQPPAPLVQTFSHRPKGKREARPLEARWRRYERGLSDKQIALAEKVTVTAVTSWRREHGLPANWNKE